MTDAPPDPLLALRPWESPEVTSWGRLPMNAVDRRAGAVCLDGDWRFQLLPAPDSPVGEVWSSSYVPGVWTMQGTDDLPRYLNVRMPFAEFPPHVPAANPTGVYERAVDVPAEWTGLRIVLRVGAAESVLLVHVDGRPTGIVQYEGAAKRGWADPDLASDIACPMYAPLEECLAHALSGAQTKPLIQCEYSHAMGNSNGTLADHWAAIEATPGLQGGFIWEFRDHGILQRVNDGRPAGRGGAGLYDNGVAAPGHRWAYGGDFGETDHDGAFIADGVVFPDRTPKPVMFEHREIAAPVRLESFRHEGVVMGNHQHFRSLDWLCGEWELSLADGITLTAPAELPALRPGETAAVPLPFTLPEDGGEAWLTLRVTTARDEPWAPRGTVVCLPQVRLRAALPPVHTRVPDGSVEVDEDGLLVHPLLTAAPTLSLWRAPTDNDELGGMAARWREWGLEAPLRTVVSTRRDPGRVTVVSDYLCTGGTVRHEQVLTAVEGGLLVEESAELPETLYDVARVGTVFETVAGLNLLEWFGRGPWESYPDRAAGAPVGHHCLPVDELFTPYLRPQESGGRHGVRRFTLSAPDATGLAVRLDRARQVCVTRHRAADLAAVAHHDELVPRAGCVVHIDAAHRGLGTASCGPDTFASCLVAAGVHRWSWTLRVL
ncbi:glycoside hydrolase family 2 TIM barrel-domain containing protein [Streptomyces sp. NPDC092370]|uniref:glycoside hydrolase family 2 TIM barrel-domain containing protein n=1 Tax=Streptomyces sp. NPDC092370 TaxID=3366016 RepID=UPI0037F201AE